MKKIINTIFTIILFSTILIMYFKIDKISDFFVSLIFNEENIIIKSANRYKKDDKFIGLNETKEFYPYNKEDLINIYYTILNNGYEEFIFYCPREYINCKKDIKELANDNILLSKINNYINPFNSFEKIVTYPSRFTNTIKIKINKKYNTSEIKELEKRVHDIIYELNIDNMKTQQEKIKSIHNYIIKNVVYDEEMAKTNKSSYLSNTAYGALVQGYAICTGYSDAMALFLDYLNIKNIKISSENHVWNLVYLDDTWYHLDLTWDDTENKNYQNYYFLITTEELKKLDKESHNFDEKFYLEAK